MLTEEPSIERNFSLNAILTKVGYGVRKDPAYDMTRDGFALLVMGSPERRRLSSSWLISTSSTPWRRP